MELVKSNIPQSLNVTDVNQMSHIKPPVPPKPKIIPPKPQYFANASKFYTKPRIISCIETNSKNRVTPKYGLGCAESPDAVKTLSSDLKVFDVANNTGDHQGSNPTIPSIRVSHPSESCDRTSLGSEISSSMVEGDTFDDTSSCLMEKTLENCVEINSKSSSSDSSSLSLEESDSDESSSTKEVSSCFGSVPQDSFQFSPSTSPTLSPSISPTHSPSISPTHSPSISPTLSPSDNCHARKVTFDNDNENNSVKTIQKKAFLVAKEISSSESVFVAILKLLNEGFKKFLYDRGAVNTSSEAKMNGSNRSGAIPEKDLDEILKYLPNLQNLNGAISTDFELRIADWETHRKIADIIVMKGPFLKLYANYIMELEYHANHLQECAERYSFFGECLKEFETSGQSNFIPVSKHMLTPMQRITKYKLLMRKYLEYLPEDSADYADAVQALAIVKNVVEHANEAIRELENSARLLCLQERINGAGNSDSTLIGISITKPQHLLVEPGRRLLKEGQLMKLCRRGVRMVYLILLSDSLLYTIQELHGGKNCPLKLRYKLPLEGMRVKIPMSEDFQNEFTVISTSRSFTIRASSAKERDAWLASLRNAIESNAMRRFSFEKARTAEFDVLDSDALGSQAPAWVPDNRVTMCQLCTSEFTLTFRRHHCRACGKVVCRHCSANRAPLAYLENNTERVCDNCFAELQKVLQEMEQKEEEIIDDEERKRFRRSIAIIKGRFSQRGIRDCRTRKSRKPERLLQVCGGDDSSQICGYLRHFSRKTWRQSWFVLKDKVLYEYGAPEDVCALSSLPILGYSVNTEFKSLDIFDGMDSSNAFQLLHSNQQPLMFYGESNDLADKWRTVMEREVDL